MKKQSASSRQGKLRRVNASSISMNDELRAELEALAKRADEAIDLSDIPEMTAATWKNAEHGRFSPDK